MIDLINIFEIRNIVDNKVVEKIEDELGNLIYENWKNLIASGVPPLKLLNCKGVDLVDYKIYGKSVQELDASNMTNIWDGTYTTGTYYDDNGNLVELSSITMSNMMELTYKKYDITCINIGTILYNFRFNFFDENENWLSQILIGVNSGETLTKQIEVPNDAKYINFSVMNIVIKAGHKISPSSNNVPTPTAPIEVESVGDKTKNLLIFTLGEQDGLTREITNDGRLHVYGTCTRTTTGFKIGDYILDPGTYTASAKITGEFGNITKIAFNSVSTVTFGTPRTVTKTVSVNSSASVPIELGTEYDFYLTPMLVAGTQEIDYEPYGYRIPVKASANIYNYEDFFSVPSGRLYVSKIDYDSIYIKNYYQNIFTIPNTLFKPNTTYEISKKINIISGTKNTVESRFVLASTTGTTIKMIDGNQEKNTFTTPDDLTTYTRLWVYGMMGDGEIEINDIVIKEQGKEDITTNIYLKEPLRKMDIYTDYIDFENSKVVRVIKPSQINGNSSFSKFGAVTNYSAFYMENREMVKSDVLMNFKILSNKFRYYHCGTANTNGSWSGDYQIGTAVTSTYRRICFTLPNTITDSTSAKEWFKENPVDYYFPLETPIEEEIELPNIPTIKGTTLLSVDTKIQPSNLEVVYKGK